MYTKCKLLTALLLLILLVYTFANHQYLISPKQILI